jgi:hypothetical protein
MQRTAGGNLFFLLFVPWPAAADFGVRARLIMIIAQLDRV